MRRRQLLALTGGTVTIALAGCLDEDDEGEPADTDDETEDDGAPESGEADDDGDDDADEEVEPELEGITLDVTELVIEVEGEAEVTVTAQYDDGTEENVTDEATITSDDEAISSVTEGTVSWERGGVTTLTASFEGFEDSVEIETEEDEDAEPFELGDTFEAEGVGGYISFAEESEADAEDEGLAFPTADEDGEAIIVEATVDGDSWESAAVEFPDIETDLAEASIDVLGGLSGEIDLDNGLVTTEGTLEVTTDSGDSFEFEIAATSEESGELTGEVDAEYSPAIVTVVDNEFIIDDETENAIVDGYLGLPADDPGENWLSLTFEMISE